jgi:hypothetical protein
MKLQKIFAFTAEQGILQRTYESYVSNEQNHTQMLPDPECLGIAFHQSYECRPSQ